MYKLKLRVASIVSHHLAFFEVLTVVLMALAVSAQPVYAADVSRLTERSLKVVKAEREALSDYIISFGYRSPDAIGSINMLFCFNPIPDDPCVPPPGLDLSQAVLESQTGETGYVISFRSQNRIVLSRTSAAINDPVSSYTLGNVKNPNTDRAYAARLSTHASTNATGPIVDLGSVLTQMTNSIELQTQVPPMLYFCVSGRVSIDCEDSDDVRLSDMGDISPSRTLSATSQMAAGTNASAGFVITVNGTPMQSGSSVIDGLASPSTSQPGTKQFGLNLRANPSLAVGGDPEGEWEVSQPTSRYNIPNQFTFRDGDVVASAPEVSLARKFTVTYIVNAPENLRAGVYATTLTYICSGRF